MLSSTKMDPRHDHLNSELDEDLAVPQSTRMAFALDWLKKAWAGAEQRGLNMLTLEEINAEIDACRRDAAPRNSEKE